MWHCRHQPMDQAKISSDDRYACFLLVYLHTAVTNDATTQQSESSSPTIAIDHADERQETHVPHQTTVAASAWDAR